MEDHEIDPEEEPRENFKKFAEFLGLTPEQEEEYLWAGFTYVATHFEETLPKDSRGKCRFCGELCSVDALLCPGCGAAMPGMAGTYGVLQYDILLTPKEVDAIKERWIVNYEGST